MEHFKVIETTKTKILLYEDFYVHDDLSPQLQLVESVAEADEIGNLIEEVVDLARQIHLEADSVDVQKLLTKVGKPIDENSACVEVGTTHKHLRRGVNLNHFKNYFSSNDITCEEVKSVESTFLLDTSYVRATREPEKKETATHIGIREAEDWFRPIDLAKECDIYISSRSGSHKEIPITYGYTQDPLLSPT
ncbi:hypothetical protein TNCV_2289991 [Trichonephila clavipes]|uniref:Uncharacterized protein n=1 Tax=Trichonephila clavipes TaxID=2585209 RepID=A0A8X6RP18_TRICX|nr:hypothetical protein TNCV_2289991 [Trichonephila clavipes]